MKISESICKLLLKLGFTTSIGMVGIQSLNFYNSIKNSKLKSILITSEKNVNYIWNSNKNIGFTTKRLLKIIPIEYSKCVLGSSIFYIVIMN